jgi:hypothetical protein
VANSTGGQQRLSAGVTVGGACNQKLTEFLGLSQATRIPAIAATFWNCPMSTKLARLPATSEEPGAERRQFPRHEAWATAMLRSSHGEETEANIADVSTHGCCIKCEAEWLRTGSFVSIGLEDEPPLQAIIRWVRDGATGMEFLRPIPPERTEWHALLESSFGP